MAQCSAVKPGCSLCGWDDRNTEQEENIKKTTQNSEADVGGGMALRGE